MVKDCLDEIEDEFREDKDVFEVFFCIFGGVIGGEFLWIEILCWFVFGGYDLECVVEFVGVYKFGNGGMIFFVRLIF